MKHIENINGVHKSERLQANQKKTASEQYAEYHNLDWGKCDTNRPHEIKNKTKVIQNSNDGMY